MYFFYMRTRMSREKQRKTCWQCRFPLQLRLWLISLQIRFFAYFSYFQVDSQCYFISYLFCNRILELELHIILGKEETGSLIQSFEQGRQRCYNQHDIREIGIWTKPSTMSHFHVDFKYNSKEETEQAHSVLLDFQC